MCGSTVDIQSLTAEIRQAKKERKKKKNPHLQNIMPHLLQGSHNKLQLNYKRASIR